MSQNLNAIILVFQGPLTFGLSIPSQNLRKINPFFYTSEKSNLYFNAAVFRVQNLADNLTLVKNKLLNLNRLY